METIVSLPQGKHWKITDNLLVGLTKLPESLRQQLCRALLEKYDLASLRWCLMGELPPKSEGGVVGGGIEIWKPKNPSVSRTSFSPRKNMPVKRVWKFGTDTTNGSYVCLCVCVLDQLSWFKVLQWFLAINQDYCHTQWVNRGGKWFIFRSEDWTSWWSPNWIHLQGQSLTGFVCFEHQFYRGIPATNSKTSSGDGANIWVCLKIGLNPFLPNGFADHYPY